MLDIPETPIHPLATFGDMRNLEFGSRRRSWRRMAVVGIAVGLLVGCSADDGGAGTLAGVVESTDAAAVDVLEAERAALEEQIEELQAEIDALRAELADRDDPTPPIPTEPPVLDEPEPTTTTQAPEPETSEAAAPSTSPGLFIRGDVQVPPGDGSGLQVVMVGTPSSSSVPLIVRNNTSQPAYRIEVTGTARSAEGALVASGSSQGFSPILVQPGEWAFGYLYLGTDISADEVNLDFSVSSQGTGPGSFGTLLDIEISEAEYLPDRFSDRIVGIVRNQLDVTVTGPISVDVACFDGDRFTGTNRSFTDGGDLAPGATDSFTVNLYSDEACSAWVVASSGYDF